MNNCAKNYLTTDAIGRTSHGSDSDIEVNRFRCRPGPGDPREGGDTGVDAGLVPLNSDLPGKILMDAQSSNENT